MARKKKEEPVEEIIQEEVLAEELPVEEAPVEEAPVEEAPVEETPVTGHYVESVGPGGRYMVFVSDN